MINTFKNSYKVAFVEKANAFIYLLKQLPIIGKRIPEGLYKETDTKQTIGIIVQVLIILGGFVKACLYLGLMVGLPAFLFVGDSRGGQNVFFHILFFLSFLASPFVKSTFLNKMDKNGYKMIVLMRADAREYYLSTFLFNSMTGFVYLILPMLGTSVFLGFSSSLALAVSVEIIAMRMIGEWFQLWIYSRFNHILIENNIYGFVVILGMLAAAYGLPAIGMTVGMQSVLGNVFVIVLILGTGILSFLKIYQYNKYNKIAKTVLTRDNIMKLGSLRTDMKFGDVKLNEKRIDKRELETDRHVKKDGYEYLNYLFFRRHKKMLLDPILKKTAIIGVMIAAGLFVVLFVPSLKGELMKQLPKSTPMLVFLMYFMASGEKMCKAMFHNCDVSLLRYAYYREGRVILSNFVARLKRVVLMNMIPAIALCVGLLVLSVVGGMGTGIVKMIPVLLCVICLSCFFSIHHLFMYYVIQPYTAELTMKSPLFFIGNIIIYFACFGSLQIKTSSYLFTLVIMLGTILYMATALTLTFRLAPRTFRLK